MFKFQQLETKENLIQILDTCQQFKSVRTLRQHFALEEIYGDYQLEIFADKTIVCYLKDLQYIQPEPSSVNIRRIHELVKATNQILYENGLKNAVQRLGWFNNDKRDITFHNRQLTQFNFQKLLNIVKGEDLQNLFLNCIVFEEIRPNQYFQLTGQSLIDLYKIVKEQLKISPGQIKKQRNTMKIIARHQLFYCNHTGRNPGFFNTSIFHKNNKHGLLELPKLQFQDKQNKQLLEGYLQQFMENAQKQDFNELFKKNCPLKKNYIEIRDNVYKILKLQRKEQDCKQLFNDLYEMQSSYFQVQQTIIKLLQQILPQQIFGLFNNQILYTKIREFIELKRFENMKPSEICSSMDIFLIPWFKSTQNTKATKHVIGTIKKEISKIIEFIFNKCIIPFLRYNFYISEKAKENKKIFYYRKPVWSLILKLAEYKLKQQNLEKISREDFLDVVNNQNRPVGKLRIMPKTDSFRPIMTFQRKQKFVQKGQSKKSLNQQLSDTQCVLKGLKDILPEGNLGYSVFDTVQIFQKYNEFYEKWKKIDKPELYFTTLDISKCYDSIDTKVLLDLVKNSDLIKEKYFLSTHYTLTRNKRAFEKIDKQINFYLNLKENQIATPLIDLQTVQDVFRDKQGKLELIVSSYKGQALITKQDILKKLQTICTSNIISFNKKQYKQTYGIPQGLNISSILCSFYFSHLEEEYLQFLREEFKQDDTAIFLARLTDDYIFISNKKDLTIKVIEKLYQCAERYNFKFNNKKLTTNFQFSYNNIESKVDTEFCSWIGKKINVKDLKFTFQMSSHDELQTTMNIRIPEKAQVQSFLFGKLKSLLINQFQPFCDVQIQGLDLIYQNVEMFSNQGASRFSGFIEKTFELSKFYFKEQQKFTKMLQDIFQSALLSYCFCIIL